MAAKVIGPTDTIDVKHVCALIYGQPGARKTSLAQTADNPITLAFDPGVYRAYGRKTAALFDTWEDVVSFDLSPYGAVVVDTVGMCLDKLAAACVAESPKNGNRLGGLSRQGYGVLKERFKAWVASVRERGQDLVFTAHEKVEKMGDEPYYCPDIVGGSYNTVMNVADLVGYMHFSNGKRVVDFSPTDRWMAKAPPCGWPQLALPDFGEEKDYLARLLAEAKASMGRVSQESAELAKAVEHWRVFLGAGPAVGYVNDELQGLSALQNGVKAQCWALVTQHAQKQGWTFDRPRKAFVEKAEVVA